MNAQKLRLAWLCVPLSALWIAGPDVTRGSAQSSLKVAGRIDGITVSNVRMGSVDRSEVSVHRGDAVLTGESGMPLCYGDVISTGSDVTATLRIGESRDAEKLFTLYPATKIELVDPNSLFLQIGRMFASLRGAFDVKTIFARLGARGTEFQVEVSEKAIDVVQLEGSLEYSPPVAEGGRPGIPALLPEIFAPWSAGVPEYGGWSASTIGGAQGAPVRLDRLTHMRGGRGLRLQREPASMGLIKEVVDGNSTIILATRPEPPSQNVINVYETAESRALAYREARFTTIWAPEKSEYYERLGDVYADWAEANNALRAYRSTTGLKRESRQQAVYYNSLGNVTRLAGDLETAERLYRQALNADGNFAFPFNGLGDVQLDRALAALDEGRLPEARDLLSRAEGLYRKSLDRNLWGKEGGTNRAVPLTNLGSVALHLGELSIDDAAKAQQYVAEAQRNFQSALTEAGGSPFAQAGFGRSYLILADALEQQGRKEAAAKALSQAEAQLQKTVEQHPSFAVGWNLLGAVSERQGNRQRAIDRFRRATRLDPQYAPAYHQLARALDNENPSLARLYHQTYLRVESPVFKNGGMVRLSASRVEAVAPPYNVPQPEQVPVAVPQVIGMNLSAARAQLEGAGLRVGMVDRRAGRQTSEIVIEQKPAANTLVPRGTAVDVVIETGGARPSKGTKTPDVIGFTIDRAVQEIRRRGLVEVVKQEPSCSPEGKVISQEPRKDAKVSEGSSVTIIVAGPGTDAGPVPSVVGLQQADAERAIRESGLEVGKVTQSRSSREQPNTVMKQEPGPGTPLPRGCPVRITVASAPRSIDKTVPDLRGMSIEQAQDQLGKGFLGFLSLRLGQVTERETGAPPGTVVDQDPQPGTRVSVGTPVNLVIEPRSQMGQIGGQPGVQAGVQPVDVPNVVGRTLNEATAMLNGAGLTYRITGGPSTAATRRTASPARVTNQDPPSGSKVQRGTIVNLVLSGSQGTESKGQGTPAQLPQVVGQVSMQPVFVEVPKVIGMKFEDAVAFLNKSGFPCEDTRTNTGPFVQDQNPKPGTRVQRGTKILLIRSSPIR